jgi:hypothetical protein
MVNHKCSARALAKSLLAFRLGCGCLQGVFGPALPQGKYAPFPVIPIASQLAESVAARLAAQDTLFKQQYQDDMRASPESETARGDDRDNAMLDDYSLAASVKQNAVIARLVPSWRPFPRKDFQIRIVSHTISCFTFWITALRTTN